MSADIWLAGAILLGYGLDRWWADPEGFPHPVRGIGWLIDCADRLLNRPRFAFAAGLILAVLLPAAVFAAIFWVLHGLYAVHPAWSAALAAVLVWLGLANEQLVREGRAVWMAQAAGNLPLARQRLSRIVGRDTASLDANAIRRAVLETLSENLNDGVVAPLVWLGLLGVPGLWAFKTVNTLDSMIGYRTTRYEWFGKAAARLDDALCWLPARLTVLLMALVGGGAAAFRGGFRDGHRHESPNAGYPEAALAGVLKVRLGGPSLYQGELVDKPWLNADGAEDVPPEAFRQAARLNQRVTWVLVLLVVASVWLRAGNCCG